MSSLRSKRFGASSPGKLRREQKKRHDSGGQRNRVTKIMLLVQRRSFAVFKVLVAVVFVVASSLSKNTPTIKAIHFVSVF